MSCFTTSYPNIAGAPARMADGRSFTDYRSRCATYPVKADALWGEHTARQRMINEAENFMNVTQEHLNLKVGSAKCVDTMVPEVYKRVCTYQGCQTVQGHYAGIGTGRIYRPSLSAMGADPQGLSMANTAPLPGTRPIMASSDENQCGSGDPESFWSALAPAGKSVARVYPYSAPRSGPTDAQ